MPAFALSGMDTLPYTITHYTDENGLPQNSVKFIAPDDEGFLWLATENGLVRFEGDRFRNFNSSSRISYIYSNAGRNKLFARTDKREAIRVENGRTVKFTRNPNTEDDYEFLIYNDTAFVYPVNSLPNVFTDVIHPDHFLIPVDAYDYYMIGMDSIRFIRKKQEQYRFKYPIASPWKFFTLGDSLYQLTENGDVTFFDKDKPVNVIVRGDILHYPAYRSRKKHIQLYWNFVAEQLFFYLDERCYFVEALPDGSLGTTLVVEDFDFTQQSILSIYYTSFNKRVYLGSRSKGLFVFTWKQFHPFRTGEGKTDVYYAQAPFGDDSIVTPQGIVFDAHGKYSSLPLFNGVKGKYDNYSMQVDKEGNIWGKADSNIYKMNADCSEILWSRELHDVVKQLYADNAGRLWIGTHRSGLYYLSTKDENPVPLLYSAAIKDASYMQLENADTMWAGTEKGLFRIQISKNRIDTIAGLEEAYVRSVYIPRKDEVWITTYGNGFYLHHQKRLTPLPLDKLKYLAFAHCIIGDAYGYLWITTNKGLFKASRKDLLAYADWKQTLVYYFYYGKSQGFFTNEFNGGCQPCALTLRNGDISLPSLDGIVRFSPGTLNHELPVRKLFLDEVELDGYSLPAGDTISLPNNFLQFKLHISTPFFGDNYNTQIFYSLDGEGKDVWLPVESNRTISFSSMPSGTYRLRIRKINGFGANNFIEKTIVFKVALAWFETAWFRILVLGLLALSIVAYLRWRITSIQYKTHLLETRVSDRTRELKQALEYLQASENKLRKQTLMQQRLIAAITHDIKTPMKFLMLLSNNRNTGDKSAKAVYDALYKMYHLVENLIQYMKTHIKGERVVLEAVDLHDLLEEKAGIFRPIAAAREVEIFNNTEPGSKVMVNRQLLAVVMHNLLDNAVKYTTQGSIRMEAVHQGNEVCIKFIDTGIGMQPVLADWVNQYNATDTQVHNGIGLLIVIELLLLINGRLNVTANKDTGTTVSVILDINNSN
ncbi:Signal transduction histidine kinase [Chitinophaga niabensis]|uniref:histidine kinase n=2 Tax=Chitinophaga niabensis TaxID=536979 RepID=A0A1N6DA74_9BACT|nr:Signal transduction histidine kinase [Chitinophaga niabensis]